MRRRRSPPALFDLLLMSALCAMAVPAAASSITLTAVASITPAGEFTSSDLTTGPVPGGVGVSASGPSAEDFYAESFNVFAALARSYFRVDRGRLTFGVDVQASGTLGLTAPESAFVVSFPWANAGNATAAAAVALSDQLAVVGGPIDGFLEATLSFSGSLVDDATSTMAQSYGLVDSAIAGRTFTAYTDIGTTLPLSAQVTVPYSNRAAPLDIALVGWAVAAMFCPPPDPDTITSCGANGLAKAELLLRSIQVLDEAGRAIADAYVVGNSGLVYANDAADTPIPEPATLLLAGSALAVLAAARAARRTRR